MQTETSPSSSNRTILIIVVIVAGLCLAALACALLGGLIIGGTAFGTAFALTSPATEQGEAFLQALQDGDYAGAYSRCSAPLQQQLGSAEELGAAVETAHVRPVSWKITSRNIENDSARLEGTFVASQEGTLILTLIKEGEVWKISSFDLQFP